MPIRYPKGWELWEEDQRRAWISRKIAELTQYVDDLKKESRKMVLSKTPIRVDGERPDLMNLKP